VLGAVQVAVNGDRANWHSGELDAIPGVGDGDVAGPGVVALPGELGEREPDRFDVIGRRIRLGVPGPQQHGQRLTGTVRPCR